MVTGFGGEKPVTYALALHGAGEAAMKKIASISLGPFSLDCNFRAKFLGHDFEVVRIGTDNDFKAAKKLVIEWRDKVDAIGLGLVHDHYSVGTRYFHQRDTDTLEKLAGDILVTTGARLREIVQEWSLRSAQHELGNFFNNAKVLFLSGAANYRLASVMGEFTQNLSFADPVLQFGAPGLLHSLRALELYAAGSHPVLRVGPEDHLPSLAPARRFNRSLLKKAVRDADAIVASYHQLERYGPDELEGKVVLTSTISPVTGLYKSLTALTDSISPNGSPAVTCRPTSGNSRYTRSVSASTANAEIPTVAIFSPFCSATSTHSCVLE